MTWYNEAIFYHIYPLGALGAPKINDHILTHRLKDMDAWLTHISDLGIDALYIGPLFESETHGYDTIDYGLIDSRLGDVDDMKMMVKKAHELGIKVVVDGVFNHVGRSFFAFKDVLEKREASDYKDWFYIDFSHGEPFAYATWQGYDALVKLALDNVVVQDYLLDKVGYWIDEFDIDGIRLDCADCLDFDFLRRLRYLTDHKKDDFWLMGELIHGDYSRFIKNDLIMSSTNYELHKGLYSAYNDHNLFEIAHTIKRQSDPNYGLYKGMYLYDFVDNHDVDRLASKVNDKRDIVSIYVLLFTLIGIPSIYYGSEYALEGKRDAYSDDILRPYIDIIKMSDNETTELIKRLASIKKEHKALSYGTYKEVYLTNRAYAYLRTLDDDTLLIVTSCEDDTTYLHIHLDDTYHEARSLLNNDIPKLDQSEIEVMIAPHSAMIIKLSR